MIYIRKDILFKITMYIYSRRVIHYSNNITHLLRTLYCYNPHAVGCTIINIGFHEEISNTNRIHIQHDKTKYTHL